jgi:hypothetical protein
MVLSLLLSMISSQLQLLASLKLSAADGQQMARQTLMELIPVFGRFEIDSQALANGHLVTQLHMLKRQLVTKTCHHCWLQ